MVATSAWDPLGRPKAVKRLNPTHTEKEDEHKHADLIKTNNNALGRRHQQRIVPSRLYWQPAGRIGVVHALRVVRQASFSVIS